MDFKLTNKQHQKITLTKDLRQAISILQYSSDELREYLESLALDNPLIEIKEHYFDNHKRQSTKTYEEPHEYYVKKETSIKEFLLNQVGFLRIADSERRVVEYLILMLNDNGYFTENITETAKYLRINTSNLLHALKIVQELEPAGIGARNVQESLLIQLGHLRADKHTDLARSLINDHFDKLSNFDRNVLISTLNTSEKEVQTALGIIKNLNPRPALCVDLQIYTKYISPDLIVENSGGRFTIQTVHHTLPNVYINPDYKSFMNLDSIDQETRKYLNSKYQEYSWLIKSLGRRKATLSAVMTAIVEKQFDFFHKGHLFLKPLTLKEVALSCNLHESTVSRATNNKFVQTPFGIHELKFFFSSGILTRQGQKLSANKILSLIEGLVRNENPFRPLSDQKLTHLLNEDGILISRRTVTKYREKLSIPTSRKRRISNSY